MHKKGVIDYSETKTITHKVITRVIRTNEEFKSYIPKFSLRKSKKAAVYGQDSSNGSVIYPKVNIEEVYQFSKHLNCVMQNVSYISKR